MNGGKVVAKKSGDVLYLGQQNLHILRKYRREKFSLENVAFLWPKGKHSAGLAYLENRFIRLNS